MGLEVETMCYAPEEVMQTANQDYDWSLDMPATRAKTTSLGGLPKSNKKRMMTTTNSTMRKSLSDKPLVATNSSTCLTTPNPVIASSASLESGLGESNQVSLDADIPASGSSTIASGRRQQLLDRADEILNGKTHVGMQLGETCPVCLTDDVDTQLTGCGHRVHAKCIKRWIYQSGAKCPVCREVVSGVQEAYSGPPSGIFHHALEKDLAPDVAAYSDDATTSTDDNQANEWGWFEEFDDTMDEDELLPHLHNQRRRHSVPSAHSPVLNREMSTTFEVCRTFPPLRPEYDTLYADSKHSCLHTLPSHRHIAAKIQIRSFRIVETKSKTQHAEYLIEVQLDGKYISKWRRFSELCRFVGTLGTNQFHRTLAAWAELEAASRWFNRLEVAYLHRRCRMLEEFAHALLLESSSAHPLAGLLEG